MKTFLPILSLFFLAEAANSACVPAREEVAYPATVGGGSYYVRVHPSGNYIIVSGTSSPSRVTIIDFTDRKNPKAIATPLNGEAYPVEGSWDLIASPLHYGVDGGMKYFRFEDILKDQAAATAVYTDREHNNWYHSSAELPGSSASNRKFRTMLYGEPYRDYSLSFNENKALTNSKKSETKRACRNLTSSLSSPILSKDGTEVAARGNSGITIYKINDDATCSVVEEVGYASGKVSFSYPNPNSKGSIVFTGSMTAQIDNRPQSLRGILLYDRDKKITNRISSDADRGASYPGMVADGRVVYVDGYSRKIIIVDPNQLKQDGSISSDQSKCVQTGSSGSVQTRKSSGRRQ